MERIRIVVGLGNPGERYRVTRHNIGFWVVDRLADSCGSRFAADDEFGTRSWISEARLVGMPVMLAKPRTYMNLSGRAGSALCRAFAEGPQQMLVVYDDADLEFGRIRVRPGGSAGGHNGMRSMIDSLRSTEIPRIRLGVRGERRDGGDLADYVLEPFEEQERARAEELCDVGAEAVRTILESGLTEAMNRYNGRFID